MIGQTISHYRVLSRLGAGGMGVVYEAEDTRLGRRVAIKLLPEEACCDPEAVERFLREARAISSLNHPHICTLHDIGEHAGQQYMVMEMLEGEPLRTRIDRGPLPLDQVLEFGAQMADALDAAHAQGVVHRDIKPANLFITRRGQLKVLDFGVAKLTQAARDAEAGDTTRGASGSDQLTTMGSAIGTVAYMSPEQARGQEIDARSDLFSAGIVLAEMATGRVPFPGVTSALIFEGILTKAPPLPSQQVAGIPAEFDHIVLKALEKDRETRYQGAAELRADLKRLRRDTDSGRTPAQGTVAPHTAAGVVAAPHEVSTPHAASGAKPRRSSLKRGAMVGAPLVTLAIVGGVLLFRSISAPALTEKDPVVLADVVNRTGDAMFDDTLREALGLQLRQSPFLRVVADQKVRATLRLMGRDAATLVTPEVGREVCQRLGAKALMGGSIAMLGSAYVVTLRAEDCVSGNILAEEQVQAASKEKVLEALGGAVSVFRERLGESLASIQRYDAKIEQATTPSLEALKAYGQGMRTRQTTGDFESVPFFKRAIELDPEFALAYARLGTVYSNLSQGEESRKMTERAFELRQKVSEAERLYIEARYYSTVKRDWQKAIESYRLSLATYPGDNVALTNLGLLEKGRGDHAAALRNFEEAVRVAPEQPLGWLNLGETYTDLSRYDEGRRAIDTALKLQDSTAVRARLFIIGVLTDDRALADAQVEATRGRRDEVDILEVRIRAATYLGRMKEAATLGEEWQPRMAQASRTASTGEGLMILAVSEALVGLEDAARQRMVHAKANDLLTPGTLDEQLMLSALLKDGTAARMLLPAVVAESKKTAPPGPEADSDERTFRALAALAEGKAAEAVQLLEPLTFDAAHSGQATMWSLAQMRLRQWDKAAKGMAWLDTPGSGVDLGPISAVALASLARAQAAMGQTDAARKTYQKFFDLWKDADADVPLLVQAKAEFVKLGSS